jgi:hypothetical protein
LHLFELGHTPPVHAGLYEPPTGLLVEISLKAQKLLPILAQEALYGLERYGVLLAMSNALGTHGVDHKKRLGEFLVF